MYETVPTFRPSLEEMRDFNGYLLKLKAAGADKTGLTKIIPPKEWQWNPSINKAREMRVRNPIQQCVAGKSGVFSVCNIVKRDLKLKDYEELAMKQKDIPEDFSSQDSYFQVERKFWKSLTTTAKPPLYGSDVEGTLFGDEDVPFNVNTLDCLLKRVGVRLPGITNPMMYVGMWRSFFPFHTEDVNMFSINVMHWGAPKFWYGIPPAETTRVENLGKSAWPEEKCPELMRHKTKLFSPSRLKQAGVSFVRGVQHKGEIMITWPSSFHGGFNAGFNIAEAVNFVPEPLLDFYLGYARKAGFCKCRPDSVTLNIPWLEERIQALREGRLTEVTAAGDLTGKTAKTVRKPRKGREKLLPTPLECTVGSLVEFRSETELGDPIWVQVQVVQIVDGSARLHEKNTLKTCDVWVSLRSPRLRLPSNSDDNLMIGGFDQRAGESFDNDGVKRVKIESSDVGLFGKLEGVSQ